MLLSPALVPGSTQAQVLDCIITGSSTAQEVNHPLGIYQYTIQIYWDTCCPHGQSHLNLGLGFDVETCPGVCENFAFGAPDTAGVSTGVLDSECYVYYYAEFNCEGDPSSPGAEGAIVKFEPYANECEPGTVGEGTFIFYSDWPPIEIEPDNGFLSMKFDHGYCVGDLAGVVPKCVPPVPVEQGTWGRIKTLYE